jgi:hypothetical protein
MKTPTTMGNTFTSSGRILLILDNENQAVNKLDNIPKNVWDSIAFPNIAMKEYDPYLPYSSESQESDLEFPNSREHGLYGDENNE